MHYLYAQKKQRRPRLVATFSSEPQLLTYTRWANLEPTGWRSGKFERGSVLAGYENWVAANQLLYPADASKVEHNPSPHML
jgi:hypothetical protein